MSSGLMVISDILDNAKSIVEGAGLAGWNIHTNELSLVTDDQLPSVVLWVLDDTTDDPTPMSGGSHQRKINLVIELRSFIDEDTGSILKTLLPTANSIYLKLLENETLDGQISNLTFKAMNTIGDSSNPKYCGLTLQFECEYLFQS